MSTSDRDLATLRLTARRWLLAVIISGAVLALSIAIGLGATVWRLQQTFDLIDSDSVTDSTFRAMVDRSLLWTKLGLAVGALAFGAYVVCFLMRQRARNTLRAAEEAARLRARELV